MSTEKVIGPLEASKIMGDPQNSVTVAAANIRASSAPVPTREQIHKAGGGVLGYLRAMRALQRESQS